MVSLYQTCAGAVVSGDARVRLCLKDLFHQDVVEMIERETRKYDLRSIESGDHPDFSPAYQILWDAFGKQNEMEPEHVLRRALEGGPVRQNEQGTFLRYFLIVAKGPDGKIRGVRDGKILLNANYAPDLCVIYLSHIYMMPEARGTVLSYWLRIAPVELAMHLIADLHAQGKFRPPLPDAPGKYFGMRVNMAAEMEFFTPEERISWERILFYGRGGFDVINPRHFPYQQPDFRPPEEIKRSGNLPIPFMLLLRRLGRERQAAVPIREAQAVMRLLYDEFATYCAPEFLANSLQLVLNRLEERAKTKNFVELLPLPTGPQNLHRLKRLFRHHAYTRYYPDAPETRAYLQSGIREVLSKHPNYVEESLAKIAAELEQRPKFVYANRDKNYTWEGAAAPSEEHPADFSEITARVYLPPEDDTSQTSMPAWSEESGEREAVHNSGHAQAANHDTPAKPAPHKGRKPSDRIPNPPKPPSRRKKT